jgi:nucleoid-associated protein YgaU
VIFAGSRYAGVPVRQVTRPDGAVVSVLGIRFIGPTPAGYLHTVTAGDRLDLLAHRFYGDADRGWLIADANSELDPQDLLVPGRRIRIPPDRR